MKILTKEENGAIAIIVALSMTAFIGFLALVVDVGYMYEMRRQLQSAADAAALAGMAEKIKDPDISDADVIDAAEEYALKNDLFGPGDLEVLTVAPQTVVTDSYVKIGVRKKTDVFFGGIFDPSKPDIYAQAKAKRVYVTGGRGLVPWGVSTVRAKEIEASVNGVTSDLTKETGTDNWDGNLSVPLAPRADGYLIDLTIYNSEDFPQTFAGVGSVVVHKANDPVTDVYLNDNVLSPGQTTSLYIAANAVPKADIGGQRYNEADFSSVGPNLYKATVQTPANTGPFQTFPVDVSVGNQRFNNAARMVVRQSNSPIADIDFGRLHFASGGGTTPIGVTMRDFAYGELYDLKVVASPETGNFNALDFRYVFHPTAYTTNHGENDSAADYYDNLSGIYPGEIHIGDIITTKTGNLSGPQTTNSLDTRIGGCSLTFTQWEAAGKPGSCGRLIYVPIVERIERITGQSDVLVNAIAVFFLERYEKIGNDKVNITGRFIEYARTGSYSDTPPDTDIYLETVRLDKPDY